MKAMDCTDPLSTFPNIDCLEAFLENELEHAHSDSERVFIYQRAFDYLASEFFLCRPLLERIKQQYDRMSRTLLAKKREMIVDATSSSTAEDSLAEMVNHIRRARTQEFVQNRAESERLLDEMTELRVQRSDLLKQLEVLTKRKEELASLEASYDQEMLEVNGQVQDVMIDIRQAETAAHATRKDIHALKSKIAKTETSSADLAVKEEALAKELDALKKHEEVTRLRLFDMNQVTGELENQMAELRRTLDSLEVERELALKRKNDAVEVHATLEDKFRRLVGNRTAPLHELLQKSSKKSGSSLTIG
jgi:chromosome segregation ATPase